MFKTIFNKLKVILLIIFIFYIFITIFSSLNLPLSNSKDEIKSNIESLKIQTEVNQNNKKINNNNHYNEIKNIKISEINWIKFTNFFYILNNTYLDLRKKNEYFIRFLTLQKIENQNKLNLKCKFENRLENFDIFSYEFNENHGMEYGGFIHSCKIPSNFSEIKNVILFDKISKKSKIFMLKKLINFSLINNYKKLYNFTICVPPLFGNLHSSFLIAFIEMNRILGAEHFYFYNYNINDNKMIQVLNFYVEIGLVTLFKWNIPNIHIWYNGQMSSIHHCLYENIGITRYTVFQDLDELLVPLKDKTWSALMEKIDKDKRHSGFKVPMVFMSPLTAPLWYTNSVERSLYIDNVRSKCIVIPHLIFEQGIHHISKQNVEEYTPLKLNDADEHALLFHFKKCNSMFGFVCSGIVKENRLMIYKNQFIKNYNSIKV